MKPPIVQRISIPIQITKPVDALFKIASELGQNTGRDRNWQPGSPEEAIWEIVIMSGDPELHGVLVLPENSLSRADVFALSADISCLNGAQFVVENCADLIPQDWPVGFANAVSCAIQSASSPADFGFEIFQTHTPSAGASAHQKIETIQSLLRATRKQGL